MIPGTDGRFNFAVAPTRRLPRLSGRGLGEDEEREVGKRYGRRVEKEG